MRRIPEYRIFTKIRLRAAIQFRRIWPLGYVAPSVEAWRPLSVKSVQLLGDAHLAWMPSGQDEELRSPKCQCSETAALDHRAALGRAECEPPGSDRCEPDVSLLHARKLSLRSTTGRERADPKPPSTARSRRNPQASAGGRSDYPDRQGKAFRHGRRAPRLPKPRRGPCNIRRRWCPCRNRRTLCLASASAAPAGRISCVRLLIVPHQGSRLLQGTNITSSPMRK
jgi:hypothetical protein